MLKINKFEPTKAMQIDALVKTQKNKIYNLSAGDPNIELQDCILDAYKSIDVQSTHQYSPSQGLLELREKIYPTNPNSVVITNGAKSAIYESLKAISDIDDEVIIVGPCWNSYMEMCKLLNLKYKLILNKDNKGYCPNLEEIENAITVKTVAILFNNPNNPTGYIYERDFIDGLLKISNKYKIWIISDEIYSDLRYTKKEFISLKGYPNVIYINGFSKNYNLTGWRFGYVICNEELAKTIVGVQSQITGPPSTLIQKIILECYDKLKLDISEYKKRIKVLSSLKAFSPEGAFYYYVPIGKKWKSSLECCEALLKDNIAITPGDDYGVQNTIRISIANISVEELKIINDELAKIIAN